MHSPRPYGRFGPQLNTTDEGAADALMRRTLNLKSQLGVQSLRLTRALPGGGVATAIDMGGVTRLIVAGPSEQEELLPLPDLAPATTKIPLFFSGVVERDKVRQGESTLVRVTEQTRKRAQGYKPPQMLNGINQYRCPEVLELRRLTVGYGPKHQEFVPQVTGVLAHTQFTQLRPTWFSGAMAQVVQVAMGYGSNELTPQEVAQLPQDSLEIASLNVPKLAQERIKNQMVNVRLPGYRGAPPKSGQVQFDYKFHLTHGVAFASDKKPWLVQIDGRGVYAMPLPLVPATTTAAFREYMEEVGDQEVLWLLDRFGGMPSGEGFPESVQEREAWQRAGVIQKLCEVQDFYQHLAYSPACGWSFNASGTEAYNTCYDYDEAEGLAYGLTYKVHFNIGPTTFDGKIQPDWEAQPPWDAEKRDAYLGDILNAAKAKGDGTALALLYKLRRQPIEVIMLRAWEKHGKPLYDPQAEYRYWDELDMSKEPIASANASLQQVNRGWLYSPAKFEFQPQMKYPDPYVGYCVSFDFSPLENGRGKSPKCDTIMYAYHVGDDIKVVKYFCDDRKFTRRTEDNYDECMTVGSWERKEYIGQSGLSGDFYITDLDERESIAPTEKVTTIVGVDKGYDSVPCFAFDYFYAMQGSIWRNKYFTHETKTTTSANKSMQIGLCAPYLCRDAVLYARSTTVQSVKRTHALELKSVQDPYAYRMWTYDFVMHWTGGPAQPGKGKPYPKDSNPVWVESESYNPTPCGEIADNGPWIPGLPADYTWLVHPEANVWKNSGGGGAPKINAFSRNYDDGKKTEEILHVSLMPVLQKAHENPHSHYFISSPDSFGFTFYRDACRNAAGDAEYGNVSEENPMLPKTRVRFGYSRLVNHTAAYHFIGVINE